MAAKLHSERVPSLPKYRKTLALEERKSFDEKLKLIENIDPYNASNFLFSDSMELWPQIEFPDIANYLNFSTSSYTKEQLKAYKSLDVYKYFVAGWVRGIFVGKATDNIKILIWKVGFFFPRNYETTERSVYKSSYNWDLVNHMTWHLHLFIALLQVKLTTLREWMTHL